MTRRWENNRRKENELLIQRTSKGINPRVVDPYRMKLQNYQRRIYLCIRVLFVLSKTAKKCEQLRLCQRSSK
jgi:hypothetical protein